MAQKVITELVDDLDGSEADQTVEFGLGGVSFEIDLSDENAERLREGLRDYIDVARRVGRHGTPGRGRKARAAASTTSRNGSRAKTEPEQFAAIREWARRQGMTVSDRGRIPADIRAAFDAVH